MSLTISKVRVIRNKRDGVKRIASVHMTLGNGIILHNMGLMPSDRDDGPYFLQMPSVQSRSGRRYSVFFPLSNEVRQQMTAAATEAMEKANEAGANDFTYVLSEDTTTEPVITNVRIRKANGRRPIRAYATVVIDDALCLGSFAISCSEDTNQYEVGLPTYTAFRWSDTAAMHYEIPDSGFPAFYDKIMSALFAPVAESDRQKATA